METNKLVYVAIGKEVEERESILKWVFKNFSGKTIFVIHVYVPAKRIPLPCGLELPVRLARKNELEAFRAQERETVFRVLDGCNQFCAKLQVPCEGTFIERDSVSEGILELVNQLRIENLVMGASASNLYWNSVGMTKLISEKTENVLQSAPDFCHIWFICNDRIIYKREGVMEPTPSAELREEIDHKLSLESEIEKFNLKVKELETKLVSEVKLSEKYKTEHKKLQIEIESAQCSGSIDPLFFEFTYMELQKATNGFDPSLKIGEGAYGSMYKGFLRHIQVAIKVLVYNCVQNHREFDEQVNCISKLRHPNLVTLIGACREPWALVYEYLPNGPLIDQLICKNDNTPPLPWQMRIRIAIDICSALIFLHLSNPTCTAQSDLAPVKLLLDANFSCKITDFSVFSNRTASTNLIITRLLKPIAGPDSVKAGNIESDVYSFGIIVLQLLTGNPATLGIVKKVKYALSAGALDRVMDPLAGEWPFVQAQQLAHMAVRCCDLNSSKRPDLASDVWRILAPMRASCSSLSLLSMASRDNPPHYFICPILQETMEDPHIAADGFTYEAEAIRSWFDSGHDTSPMTNMQLTSFNLTPNRALRSVIQEWLQLTSTK